MILSRDQILSAPDLDREEFAVPEWGGSIFIRVLSLAERYEFERRFSDPNGKPVDAVVLLVALCVCDEHGRALFTAADVEVLKSKNADVILRISQAASRLNGLTKEDVDGLVKNS